MQSRRLAKLMTNCDRERGGSKEFVLSARLDNDDDDDDLVILVTNFQSWETFKR